MPIASGTGENPSLAVTVRIDAPGSRRSTAEQVRLRLSLFDVDGRPEHSLEQTVTAPLAPAAGNEPAYQVLWPVDVEPGQYQVRVFAEVPSRDLSGNVVASVTVPDFEKEDVSLSGLVLEGGPVVPSVPLDAFPAVMPVVPTTERVFSSGDEVAVFCRVFQRDRRPKPIALVTRIVNREGTAVFERPETLAPDRFAPGGSADHRLALPLGELGPGAYTLSVVATLDADSSATRTIPFTIR